VSKTLDNEHGARLVQAFLAAEGYPLAVDGWFGARSVAAWEAWRAARSSAPLAGKSAATAPAAPAPKVAAPEPAQRPGAPPLVLPPVSRPLSEVIVHCTATRPDWWAGRSTADKVAEVRRWHMQGNGWRNIGYHLLIDRNGTVAFGRPLAETGTHTMGRNPGTIGVALFGGHGSASTDRFGDHFTPEQDAALRRVLAALQAHYGPLAVTGHNQWAAKACPGFNVPKWLKGA
jgi:N-acetylmuramoyl-L-alanine amidase